ncbi:MAG: hypothetical protein H6636_06900 [Anaerolineales bacterium]|nr:hypothetical protein [Anaerolineales bacterium]
MPLPTPTPTILGSIGNVLIGVLPDPQVVPGQQWICLTDNFSGIALTQFLGANWHLSPDSRWIMLPHDADVDYRLKILIDLCAAIRLSAPHLVQLELQLTDPGPVENPRD